MKMVHASRNMPKDVLRNLSLIFLAYNVSAGHVNGQLRTGDAFAAKLRAYGASLHTDGAAKLVQGWSGLPGPQPFTLADGSPVYSESTQMCPALWLSGSTAGHGGRQTLIVEQGTLTGASSRCLAAGLTRAQETRPNAANFTYYAFDFFSSMGWSKSLERHNLTSQNSMLVRAAQRVARKKYPLFVKEVRCRGSHTRQFRAAALCTE